jgi:Family of unknown function (DUF6152)
MRTFPAFAAIATLTLASPAWAHHPSESEFDGNAPVRLSGTITRVYWVDHTWSCRLESSMLEDRPATGTLRVRARVYGQSLDT